MSDLRDLIHRAQAWVELADRSRDLSVFSDAWEHSRIIRALAAHPAPPSEDCPTGEGVGTGADEGAPGQGTGSAWVTRSADCPEAPAQAHPLAPAVTDSDCAQCGATDDACVMSIGGGGPHCCVACRVSAGCTHLAPADWHVATEAGA